MFWCNRFFISSPTRAILCWSYWDPGLASLLSMFA